MSILRLLNEAVEQIKNGRMSIGLASRTYDIPHNMLRNYRMKSLKYLHSLSLFSKKEELKLVDDLLVQFLQTKQFFDSFKVSL